MEKLILIFTVLLLNSNIVNTQDYWEIVNTPPDINIYSMEVNSNKDIFIGVGFSIGGGVLSKLNNGNIWDTSLYLNNEVIGTIYIDSLDNIFAADVKIYYSDNNGDNWDLIYTSQDFGITSIYKNSHDSIFIGTWGGIYKSDSIGSNWQQVLSLENTEIVNAIIEDKFSGILYSGTTNFIGGGGAYRSEDGGDNWEHIGLTDHYISSLAINSSGDLFAGTRGHYSLYEGGVYILPNGQPDWINLNNEELVTSLVINSEDAIYIGCSTLDWVWGGVRLSMDNGQTWEDISLETMYDRDIEDLVLGPQEHLYALEYNSPTPMYKSVNSTITSTLDIQVDKTITTYNYPNPFSDETTIYFELPVTTPIAVQIGIYNSQGNRIEDITLPKYFGKEKSIKWNSKELPAGIYYYELTAGSIHTFKKMVLQK